MISFCAGVGSPPTCSLSSRTVRFKVRASSVRLSSRRSDVRLENNPARLRGVRPDNLPTFCW
jgi:hypothetical protein